MLETLGYSVEEANRLGVRLLVATDEERIISNTAGDLRREAGLQRGRLPDGSLPAAQPRREQLRL